MGPTAPIIKGFGLRLLQILSHEKVWEIHTHNFTPKHSNMTKIPISGAKGEVVLEAG